MTSEVSAAATRTRPRLAFLYSSRESLWAGIGAHLYGGGGVVAESLEVSEAIIRARLGWSLRATLVEDQNDAALASAECLLEPALTAVQIALTDAWRELGVEAEATAGRSGGEIAAGYARRLLTQTEAVELACEVARLWADPRVAGRVITVALPIETVERLQEIAPVPFHVICDGSKQRSIIACSRTAEEAVLVYFHERGVDCRSESLAIAPHCPIVDVLAPGFLASLKALPARTAAIPGYTPALDVTMPSTGPDAHYWWQVVVRRPVRLRAMIRTMMLDGYSVFVEIGGRPSYAPLVGDINSELGLESTVLPTMRWREASRPVIEESFASLRCLGMVSAERVSS